MGQTSLSIEQIISESISALRVSGDMVGVLERAIENLRMALEVDLGIVWQIRGDRLQVTNVSCASAIADLRGSEIDAIKSTPIILDFLKRFPSEECDGVIELEPDSSVWQPVFAIAHGYCSRLVVQLRSRGVFLGLIEMGSTTTKSWTDKDKEILAKVAAFLSVSLQQSCDRAVLISDARQLELLTQIMLQFAQGTPGVSASKGVGLIAEFMGFSKSALYLFDPTSSRLVEPGSSAFLELSDTDNFFVNTFTSGRGTLLNMDGLTTDEPPFGQEQAVLVPLQVDRKLIGVFGLWQRGIGPARFQPQDREACLWFAGQLGQLIDLYRRRDSGLPLDE